MIKRHAQLKPKDSSSVNRLSEVNSREMDSVKVKTFYGWSEKSMDRKINEFLEDTDLEIVDIKFATPVFVYSAMVIYKTGAFSKDRTF